MSSEAKPADPHGDGVVRTFGPHVERADGAVVLLHGRGGSAEDILSLARELNFPNFAYLAPQAAEHSWYPFSFLAPRSQNEPWLSSALRKVEATIQKVVGAGISRERIVVCGFSQGACLASEFVATYPGRYAGVIAFTGGLIGPLDADLNYSGDLLGTPAFFGSGDPDPHVPWTRVQQSADVLSQMGAAVTIQRYPGRAHTISDEELVAARRLFLGAFSEANR